MPLRTTFIVALASLLLAAGGCAGGSGSGRGRQGGIVLPDTEPTLTAPDLSALKAGNAVQLATALAQLDNSYRALTPIECQCLAVEASALGDLLASERGTVKQVHSILRPREAHRSAVERRMLYYASQEARNKSAGDALRIYWGLAEAENSRGLLRDSQAEARRAVADLEELQRRGLAVPVDATVLRSQTLALDDRGLELELTVRRLNEQLKSALNLDTTENDWRIWPAGELKFVAEELDVDESVAEGLQLRPEVRLLRMLSANLDQDTLPAARRALGSVNGALGATTQKCCGCLGCLKQFIAQCCDCELPVRARQIAEYRRAQEAAVESEIRQAAFAVATAAARVAIAENERSLKATNLSNLEARQPTGHTNAFEVSRARLDLFEAQREVITQLVAWETARVELREAQGKLVDECRSGH